MKDNDKNRLNDIIAQTRAESAYSEFYHEEYYDKKRTFGYIKDYDDKVPIASVDHYPMAPHLSMDLVLNMKNPDPFLVNSLHHELVHVHQLMKCNKEKISTYSNVSADDYLAQCILFEIHAYGLQAEGPLRGYLDAVEYGNFDAIENYVESMSFQKTFDKVSLFAESALDMKVKKGNAFTRMLSSAIPFVSDLMNGSAIRGIGTQYQKEFAWRNEAEQEAQWIEARKIHASHFLRHDGQQNNQLLDRYVRRTLSQYTANREIRHLYVAQEDPTCVAPTMDRLVTVMENKNDVFLPEKDWHEALNADNNHALVENIMRHSKHGDLYQQALKAQEKYNF